MPQACCGLKTPNTLCLLNETAKTGEDAVQHLTLCQGLLCCCSCREEVIQKREYTGLNQAQETNIVANHHSKDQLGRTGSQPKQQDQEVSSHAIKLLVL